MKIGRKFISALAALSIAGSCTALPVYAQGTALTLEELFAMSDDEFIALDSSLPDMLKELKRKVNTPALIENDGNKLYGDLTGVMKTVLKESDVNYTANVTEAEIAKLLGSTVKYKINSPLFDMNEWWGIDKQDYVHYSDNFSVTFPDYEIITTENSKATDEEIIEFMKCWYCVNQVIDVPYYSRNYLIGGALPDYEKILDGDVNLDRKVDKADAEHMKKALSGEFDFTEDQLKIADVNGDGVFDMLDAEKLESDIADAEKYAVPEEVEPSRYGDVNCGGTIDIADVVKLNLFLLNTEKYPLTDVQKVNADCIRDGVINASDSNIIINYVCMKVDESQLGN